MKIVLPLILVAVVLVSGCTIPGTDILIPWGNTISQGNDVVIIRDISATPSTVTAPQPVRLTAAIQNQGTKQFPLTTLNSIAPTTQPPVGLTEFVVVELYDTCQGLFTDVKVECPSDSTPTTNSLSCNIKKLLPKETKEISWILTPDEKIKLITPCELKVAVSYPFVTDGLTTINFINTKEYERQVAQGTYTTKTSTVSLGEGPVKVWYEVKDKQPIPAAPISANNPIIPVNVMIDNMGNGFVKENTVSWLGTDYDLTQALFKTGKQSDCEFLSTKTIKLISGERELPCWIKQLTDNDVDKETTNQLTARISYLYEFRDKVTVTIEPQFQT